MRTQTIAVSSLKGGVAKTTTAVNLAAALSQAGKRVLLIDLDPQGHCARATGFDPSSLKLTTLDLFLRSVDPKSIILKTIFGDLSLMPSNFSLGTVEVALADADIPASHMDLRDRLKGVTEGYDFVIIDCPPSLSYLTYNALTAADWVLLPVQCEYFATSEISMSLSSINNVKRSTNPDLEILGILLTMYDQTTRICHEVAAEIFDTFADSVFPQPIPTSISLVQSQAQGIPINYCMPTSRGSIAYESLAREVIARTRERASEKSEKK